MPAAPPTKRQLVIVGLDDDRERDGRDREEDAPHAQGQQPDAEAEQAADHGGGRDLHARAARSNALDQQHGGIDADAEEGVGAEIDVAGIAAEDGPGDRQHDELQDHVAGKERIFVADQLASSASRRPGRRTAPDQKAIALRCMAHLPNRPCGRTASTPSSSANEIAGAQDAPNMVSTIDLGDAEDDGGDQRAGDAAEARP